MYTASSFKKRANVKVAKTCILLFGRQGPPKIVPVNQKRSTKFIHSQTGYIFLVGH